MAREHKKLFHLYAGGRIILPANLEGCLAYAALLGLAIGIIVIGSKLSASFGELGFIGTVVPLVVLAIAFTRFAQSHS